MATQRSSISYDTISRDDVILYTRADSTIEQDGQFTNDISMAISNFHIQLDQVNNILTPGEVISGRVIMDVWSAMSIRFVEFIIQGQSTANIYEHGKLRERPVTEIILDKRIELISPTQGKRTMVLAPGKYVTKFNFTLPENLPYTIQRTELKDGLQFEIGYEARANIAADIESHVLSPTVQSHIVKIIKSCKKVFTIQPPEKLMYSIESDGNTPVTHAEQITTCCTSKPISILFHMDKTIYSAGETAVFNLEILSQKKKNVRKVTCILKQSLTFHSRKPENNALLRIHGIIAKEANKMIRLKFEIPFLRSLVPSMMPANRLLNITYSIGVKIELKGFGGDVVMDVPITIAPPKAKEEDENDVPVFTKPVTQFPSFSTKRESKLANGVGEKLKRKEPKTRDTKVTTRYVNDFVMCNSCIGCCGVGIHEE